jgi:hypothetical protein
MFRTMQDLSTSAVWWQRTKINPSAFQAWLYDQYRGEVTAASRIEALRDAFTAPGRRAFVILTVIADQERKHASWVSDLLRARGLDVHIEPVVERYWKCTVPEVVDLETGAAIGAHAEKMRLERIEAIASDSEADADVRSVFRRILPEERFHERAFRSLASEGALARTAGTHELGRRALGLAP